MICAVTIPPADLRSLSSYYYAQSTAEDPLKMVVKKDRNV